MKLEVNIIEMPNAYSVNKETAIRKAIIEKEQQLEKERIAMQSIKEINNLIIFINNQIEKAKNNGIYGFSFNLDDNAFSEKDERCLYHFDGYFSHEIAEAIEEVYKEFGFKCSVYRYEWAHSKCYRSGEIKISWY